MLTTLRELSRVLRVPQWRIVADAVDAYSKRLRQENTPGIVSRSEIV
jgi:hypothetical protein